jgi:hypothetical protein
MKPSVGQTVYQSIVSFASDEQHVVLDVPGGSTDPFAPIIIYQANGGDNQLWNIKPVDWAEGFFWIGNKKSQLVLTVPDTPGGQVFQEGINGQDTQLWRFVRDNNVAVVPVSFVVNKHSGLVLDVRGGGIGDGTPVIHYQQNGGSNQLWFGGDEALPADRSATAGNG